MGPGELHTTDSEEETSYQTHTHENNNMANYEDNKRFGMTKLGEGNYYIWKQRTELWLRRENLWEHIEKPPPDTRTDTWLSKDSQAKATIGLLVEDKFLIDINTQFTAKETWDRLKSIHQQSSLGSRLTLYRKIFSAHYTPNTNIVDHITNILDAAGKLEDSGHKILDEVLCGALLGSLPKDYDVLITTIEGRDSKSITVDYVREKIFEEAKKKSGNGFNSGHDTKAMPTQSARGNWNTKRSLTCYYCHKVGHIRRDCRLLSNHNVHREHQTGDHRDTPPPQRTTARSSATKTEGSDFNILTEPDSGTSHRAMIINRPLSRNHNVRWIIDSGAGDHMCKDEKYLDNISSMRYPITVTTASGDEYPVTKKGSYMMTLSDSRGTLKQVELIDVLLVENLIDDLISVSKLTNQGYRITFERGTCWMEVDGEKNASGNLTPKPIHFIG